MTPLYDRLTGARVFDLAQPYYLGMPHFPTHPAYLYSLVKLHGEYVGPRATARPPTPWHWAATWAPTSMRCATFRWAASCTAETRWRRCSLTAAACGSFPSTTVAPILRRGVLLDIAGLEGEAALAEVSR